MSHLFRCHTIKLLVCHSWRKNNAFLFFILRRKSYYAEKSSEAWFHFNLNLALQTQSCRTLLFWGQPVFMLCSHQLMINPSTQTIIRNLFRWATSFATLYCHYLTFSHFLKIICNAYLWMWSYACILFFHIFWPF